MNRTLIVGLLAMAITAGLIGYWTRVRSNDLPDGRRVGESELAALYPDFSYWLGRHDAADRIEPIVGPAEQRKIRISVRDSRLGELLPTINNSHDGSSQQRRSAIAERIRTTPALLAEYEKGFEEQLRLMADGFEIPAWIEFAPYNAGFSIAFPREPVAATNVARGLVSTSYGVRLDHWRTFSLHVFDSESSNDSPSFERIGESALAQHKAHERTIVADTTASNNVLGAYRQIRAKDAKTERVIDQRILLANGKGYVLEVERQLDQVRDDETTKFLNSFRIQSSNLPTLAPKSPTTSGADQSGP